MLHCWFALVTNAELSLHLLSRCDAEGEGLSCLCLCKAVTPVSLGIPLSSHILLWNQENKFVAVWSHRSVSWGIELDSSVSSWIFFGEVWKIILDRNDFLPNVDLNCLQCVSAWGIKPCQTLDDWAPVPVVTALILAPAPSLCPCLAQNYSSGLTDTPLCPCGSLPPAPCAYSSMKSGSTSKSKL